MSNDKLNSIKDVAVYLDVSTKTIQRMVKNKLIPHAYIGKYPKFNKEQIDRWIERRTIAKI